MTRPELTNRMGVLLGGRAAEEVALGEISTGAQDDLVRATDLARSMVTELGMGESLGVMSVPSRAQGQFLPWENDRTQGDMSEQTAERIDAEVREILEQAHDRARQVLGARRDALDRIATRLLAEEVLEGDELRALLSDAAEADTSQTVRAGPRDISRAH